MNKKSAADSGGAYISGHILLLSAQSHVLSRNHSAGTAIPCTRMHQRAAAPATGRLLFHAYDIVIHRLAAVQVCDFDACRAFRLYQLSGAGGVLLADIAAGDDGDEIRIVTAITPDLFELRVGWLQHYFPFIDPANIVCCTRKEWVKGDFIIEDSIANLVRHDAYRICMNQPWNNRGAEYDDVHLIKRVNTLAEARAYINEVWKEIE